MDVVAAQQIAVARLAEIRVELDDLGPEPVRRSRGWAQWCHDVDALLDEADGLQGQAPPPDRATRLAAILARESERERRRRYGNG